MKKSICIFIFLLIANVHLCFAQVQSIYGDLEQYLQDYVDQLPGNTGNDYQQPTTAELNFWAEAFFYISNNQINNSYQHLLDSSNYQVLVFTDTTQTAAPYYYIVEEKLPRQNFWGTYVIRPNPCRRNLIIQAPHPRFDFNTGKQAIYSFIRLSAEALFLSGAHRCNHSDFSSCDGSTSACSITAQAYPISDPAHNTASIFQKATEILTYNSEDAETVFIQLHGFSKQPTDPFVILSNGTRATPEPDYAAQIRDELYTVDNSLTFKLAHLDQDWNRLLGFTNVQGRLINGSTDPCNTAATNTSGRFVHIEQEKAKLRDDETGWNKMYTALANVFNCTISDTEEERFSEINVAAYPNPFRDQIRLKTFSNQQAGISIFTLDGQLLFHRKTLGDETYIDMSKYPSGIYLMSIRIDGQVAKKKIVKI